MLVILVKVLESDSADRYKKIKKTVLYYIRVQNIS